jgi:hypothetical protein
MENIEKGNLVLKENIEMTKEEIRDYYDSVEENNDPYFYLLPFPDFMVKENPQKYGWTDDPNKIENIYNGLEYLKLKEEGKEEEALEKRLEFLKKIKKINMEKNKKPLEKPKFESMN